LDAQEAHVDDALGVADFIVGQVERRVDEVEESVLFVEDPGLQDVQ